MRHFTSNGTDQCQNGLSNLLTPYREQPRSTRSVVAYPRPEFSATKRTNDAPIRFDQQPKFLKVTHHTEIWKIEIPRSMVVEALSWGSRRSSQHQPSKALYILGKAPRILLVRCFVLALVGRKQTVVRNQFFLRKLPVRAFDSRAQRFSTPLARRRSSCPPPSPNLVRTHPIERYQALRNSAPCIARAATSQRAPGNIATNDSTAKWSALPFFSANSAEGDGRAVYVTDSSTAAWSASSFFSANSAQGSGGAVYVTDGTASLWISSSLFSTNSAQGFGGAVYMTNGSTASWSSSAIFSDKRVVYWKAVLHILMYVRFTSSYGIIKVFQRGTEDGVNLEVDADSSYARKATDMRPVLVVSSSSLGLGRASHCPLRMLSTLRCLMG